MLQAIMGHLSADLCADMLMWFGSLGLVRVEYAAQRGRREAVDGSQRLDEELLGLTTPLQCRRRMRGSR